MKPNPLIALAVTTRIVAAAVSTAGCSTTSPSTTPRGSATHTTTTRPSHPASYSSQVVLPFGDYINHLAGVAVDAAGNVYVLDSYYGQVWELAPGAKSPTRLGFNDLGQAVQVALDTGGNFYVTDDHDSRVLKLAPGASTPTVLPFPDLKRLGVWRWTPGATSTSPTSATAGC